MDIDPQLDDTCETCSDDTVTVNDATGYETTGYVDDPSTGWSSMGSLGSTGALLDEAQNLVDTMEPVVSPPAGPGIPSSAGIDPYSLPISGDNAALLSRINGQLGAAQDMVDQTLAEVGPQPAISPSVQNQLDLIQNTLRASPEQLNTMNGMMGAEIATGQVSNSIARHDQYVQTTNDTHQAIMDSNDAINGM